MSFMVQGNYKICLHGNTFLSKAKREGEKRGIFKVPKLLFVTFF